MTGSLSLDLQERVDVLEAIVTEISNFLNFDLSKWEDLLNVKRKDKEEEVTRKERGSSPIKKTVKRGGGRPTARRGGLCSRRDFGTTVRCNENEADSMSSPPEIGNPRNSQTDQSRPLPDTCLDPLADNSEVKIENEMETDPIDDYDVTIFPDEMELMSSGCLGDELLDNSEEEEVEMTISGSPISLSLSLSSDMDSNCSSFSYQKPLLRSKAKGKVVVPTDEATNDLWPKIRMPKVGEEELRKMNVEIPTSSHGRRNPKSKKEQGATFFTSTLKCPKCDFACTKGNLFQEFKEHLLFSHEVCLLNSENRLRCPYCSKTYENDKSWRNHINAYHLEKRWPTSGEKYKSRRRLRRTSRLSTSCRLRRGRNVKRHSSAKEEDEGSSKTTLQKVKKRTTLKCPRCEYVCNKHSSHEEMREHVQFSHLKELQDSDNLWSCPYCTIKFDDTKEWGLHIKSAHLRKKQLEKKTRGPGRPTKDHLICPKCDYFCRNYMIFRKHLLSHGEPVDPESKWECPYCPRKYKQMQHWRGHIRMDHLGESRKNLCSYCGFTAKRAATLTQHISKIHEDVREKLQCDQCGESFLVKRTLERHVLMKHTEGGAEQIAMKCPHCDLVLSRKSKLSNHIKAVHENIRKYPCTLCDLAFKRPEHLKRHLGSHANPEGRRKGMHKKPFIKKPLTKPSSLTTTKSQEDATETSIVSPPLPTEVLDGICSNKNEPE